jgi:hypothetical protein
MEAVIAIRGPDEFCGLIKYNGKLEVQKALLNFVLNERPYIEPLEITGKAAALLPRQMMRVVAERGARSVPLDYLRDFCNENIPFAPNKGVQPRPPPVKIVECKIAAA